MMASPSPPPSDLYLDSLPLYHATLPPPPPYLVVLTLMQFEDGRAGVAGIWLVSLTFGLGLKRGEVEEAVQTNLVQNAKYQRGIWSLQTNATRGEKGQEGRSVHGIVASRQIYKVDQIIRRKYCIQLVVGLQIFQTILENGLMILSAQKA
jgi:hypothetical protein